MKHELEKVEKCFVLCNAKEGMFNYEAVICFSNSRRRYITNKANLIGFIDGGYAVKAHKTKTFIKNGENYIAFNEQDSGMKLTSVPLDEIVSKEEL